MSYKTIMSELAPWLQALGRLSATDPSPDPPIQAIRNLNNYIADNPHNLVALRNAAACNILCGNRVLGVRLLSRVQELEGTKNPRLHQTRTTQLNNLLKTKEHDEKILLHRLGLSREELRLLATSVKRSVNSHANLSSLRLTEACAQDALGFTKTQVDSLLTALTAVGICNDFCVLELLPELSQ
ncbi:MAG: hypothetical protein JNK90_00825 [Planctomycetaceae bacterium]|nr:hypothetical protein [Planctomycetaceae bacterium]